MRVVWSEHPVTAAEIISRLMEQDPSWHPKTVRTLLGRLVRKKALAYEPQGRVYVYRPRIKEKESVAAASESFVDRVLGGSLKPMLAHFVQRRRMSRAEIEELKRILEGKED
jgi:BlaI family penicillinase repressor